MASATLLFSRPTRPRVVSVFPLCATPSCSVAEVRRNFIPEHSEDETSKNSPHARTQAL